MVNLCIDIGNSHIVIGWYQSSELQHVWRLVSERNTTADEVAVKMLTLFKEKHLDASAINTVIIGSVVPALTHVTASFVRKYLEAKLVIVTAETLSDLVVNVDQPNAVGADRLINAYACRELYGSPSIVVDLGTATTFDIVNVKGEYVGGVISPGVTLTMQSLSAKTALLPSIPLEFPPKVIGTNTTTAMQSGILIGNVAMIEGMVHRILAELELESAHVVATGGFSETFGEHTKIFTHIDPSLTLRGLDMIVRQLLA